MGKEKTIKLAEEISFRLLATKNHVDFNWLVEKLENYKKPVPPCSGHAFEEDEDYNNCGDANEY